VTAQYNDVMRWNALVKPNEKSDKNCKERKGESWMGQSSGLDKLKRYQIKFR